MRIKRRDFLFTAAGASGVALVVGATGSPSPEAFAQSFGMRNSCFLGALKKKLRASNTSLWS